MGVIDMMARRTYLKKANFTDNFPTSQENELSNMSAYNLTLDDMHSIFIIWCFGITIASLQFSFEYGWEYLKHWKFSNIMSI